MPSIRVVMPNGTTRSFREGTSRRVIRAAQRDMLASMHESDEDHRAYRAKRQVMMTGATPGQSQGGNFDADRADEIRDYWRRHRSTILETARILGIPATAIAAAPAEEYRQQNRLIESIKDAVGLAGIPNDGSGNAVMESLYGTMEPNIAKGDGIQGGILDKITNPLTADLGIGNFNAAVGMNLVKNYLSDPAHKDDPLGLGKYDGHYDQLYRDLADTDSDATIKLTGLLLSNVERKLYQDDSGRTQKEVIAGNARRALYANADPMFRDELLDEGYRTSKSGLDKRGSDQSPRLRAGYYDFYNDPRSPYQDLQAILNGY